MTENYENEKTEYIRKLSLQIETIDKILKKETLDIISRDREDKLRELKAEAERYKNKLEKNEFEIAIVGLEKAGKSTFANAMMGNDILPSDEKRCTYTSTKIESGTDSGNVKFFTRAEFNDSFTKRLATMHFENPESYSFETLSETSYKSMYNQLDDTIHTAYGGTINQDVITILKNKQTISDNLGAKDKTFNATEVTSANFKRYIKDPEYAMAVKEVSIKSSELSEMPNAVIYDVPGFDSPTQMHKDQTVEFMRKADAIILVASASKPSITQPVIDMFRNNSDVDGKSFGEKMFVYANMADGAENLEENLGVIKRALEENSIMKSNFHRMVPGSAAAHLINAGKMEPNKHTQTAVGYKEDGIDNIRQLLIDYNETERFEVLKCRVNQKQNEINDLFKKIYDENNVNPSTAYLRNYGKLLNDVTEKRKDIVEALEAYREDLRDYNKTKEISQEVKDKVVCGITSKDFEITTGANSEMQWAHNKASKQITLIALTTKIDEILREKKRKEIYQKFSEGILDIADEHHKRFDSRVSKIFAENLGISQTSKAGEILANFLKDQKHSFDGQGYYQSLIDRFSIDLFNILIDIPFGDMKRYDRFESDFENFSSLAMFDDRKSRTNSGNSQPLYYSILFHQTDRYQKNDIINGILDSIKTVLSIVPTPAIVKLVESIVLSDKNVDKIANVIKNIGNTLNRPNQTEEQKKQLKAQSETKLFNDLRGLVATNAVFENSITKDNYEKFFIGKRDKKTDDVKNEIEMDIDILHDALKDVVIKAINIEKAFLALEFRNIDQLLASLDGRVWSDFVNDNLDVINAAECNALEAEQDRQRSRMNILADIKLLLDQMNNPSTQNNEN